MAKFEMQVGRIVFDDTANSITLYLNTTVPPAPLPAEVQKMINAGRGSWFTQIYTVTLPAQRKLDSSSSYAEYLADDGTKMAVTWTGTKWSDPAPVAPGSSTPAAPRATMKEKE